MTVMGGTSLRSAAAGFFRPRRCTRCSRSGCDRVLVFESANPSNVCLTVVPVLPVVVGSPTAGRNLPGSLDSGNFFSYVYESDTVTAEGRELPELPPVELPEVGTAVEPGETDTSRVLRRCDVRTLVVGGDELRPTLRDLAAGRPQQSGWTGPPGARRAATDGYR